MVMVRRVPMNELGRARLQELGRDSAGQVSFSIIAVVLLVSSAVAGTYIANSQMEKAKQDRRMELLASMEKDLVGVRDELSLCAASRAQSIMKQWDEFPINESKISEAFSTSMQDYVSSSFPRSSAKSRVDIENWTGGLFFVEQNTLDLVPSDAAAKASCAMEDKVVEYERLPAPSEEVLGVVTSNPYYVAVGNFSAMVRSHDLSISRLLSFQRPIISALPFLESKLRTFEASSSGECSDLGHIVEYMLSTLAELRVLEGYGQPMYSSGPNTSKVITELDVYRAVAVGLLLEQVRLFRTTDPCFSAQVKEACGEGPGIISLEGSKGRELDPSELFLWFLGKTQPDIDARTLIAEAVFGLSDQLVLKMLDYMGWLGPIEALKDIVGGVKSSVDSLIAYLTGEDKAKTVVTSWIRKALSSSTSDPANCTMIFYSSIDCIVPIPERAYYVQDAAGNLYPVWLGNTTGYVDIPEYDLMTSDEWGDLYPDFKECQTSIRQLASDAVMRMAFDIATSSDVRIEGFVIDPSDGKDLFSQLANSVGKVHLNLDPRAIAEAGRNLPLFSAQYELASRFCEFVASRALDLVDLGAIAQEGYEHLAELALNSARHSYIPNLVVPVEQQLADIVRNDIEFDHAWNVGPDFLSRLEQILEGHLGKITKQVNGSVSKVDDWFAGPMVDSVVTSLVFGADKFPGIEKMVEQSLTDVARGVMLQNDLSGVKRSVHAENSGAFEFWEGDKKAAEAKGKVCEERVSVEVVSGLPPLQMVPYDSKKGYTSLEHLFPTDDMLVQIRAPWDFDRSKEEYPNTHFTDLLNVSFAPYSTQWTVSVLGVIDLRMRTNNSELQTIACDVVESERLVRIDLSIPIVVHSAWPLQGVEYNPSSTAISDAVEAAKDFAKIIWDKLGPVIGWVKDGFERIFGFVGRVFDVLSSFATRVMKVMTSALQTLVENLQEFVQKIADSVLARAVKLFIDLTGRVEFRISMFGFVIIVQTNLPDLIYRHGTDLLRLMLYTDRFGPGITLGVRVARLTDGSYDILANGTLALKGAVIEVAVDPLMHILRRFVEVHCKGNGWALDLVIPEVEPYELAEASTSDLPGVGDFLSNIPIPALGLSASIEAGLRLKYSSPFPTDIVVNEFESNPQGEDAGKEWVELYNPLSEPKSVDGWTVTTIHGKDCAIALEGTIGANGVKVFKFPEVSIDNGYPDDPFNDGDALALLDPTGKTVDMTPMLRDTANDGRTNQRSWDGGPKWVFKEATTDNSNGVPVILASSDFIAKALFEAFKEAFLQTKLEEVTASLDFITLFAKRVLNNFIENLLALVKEIIHEVIFYIKVVFSDASGTLGVGVRASFIVTGEAIVDLLRWLIHTFATFVVNLGRAHNPIAYPHFPTSFFSGLYLRFEVLFEVGLPKMVRVLGATGDISDRFAMAISISPNIPAIGRLVGKSWGNWSVDFGAYLEGVPREFAAGFSSVDTGDLIDFWIVKGRVYGI